MRVLFCGTPAVAVPTLRALLDSDHDVVGALTRPPAPVGRRRRLTPSAVHQAASEHGLPVVTTDRPHGEDELAQITALEPQISAVVAYGALLREPALSALPHGWVNLHFSLLPAWRGAAPVQHAIRAGDTRTGVSTFRIEAGLDTGPVYLTQDHPIRPWDTAGELLTELADVGAPLLVRTLDEIEAGTISPVPQPETGVSHAPRLSAADGHVNWCAPAQVVDRQIRATTPAPGAWTTYEGRRMKIGPVRPDAQAAALAPGVLEAGAQAVLVGTASTPVRLTDLAPAGKGWMDATDWARGARLPSDARFEGTDDD
ncbi:methionyl-tRNA formyltransferase [Pseudactinotalea sp. Z1748]|uniref:methionyl-tRNA formyltransferase n=1 Tax=Pseudactinotalea sp. Z1748 TaxID=3413027 RepID=UPI003C7DEA71